MADDSKAGLLVHFLHRASQRADGLLALEIGELGLTPRQFAILQAVSAANGPSQTRAATGIDRSSIADLVRRLVTNGCLKRRRSKPPASTLSTSHQRASSCSEQRSRELLRPTVHFCLGCLKDSERPSSKS
jgi:MarR family